VTPEEWSHHLEAIEAAANASFVRTRCKLDPSSGACSHNLGGTTICFDGVHSPLTQTFGLGLFAPVTPDVLQAIETFYAERSAVVYHEVSPYAGTTTLQLLDDRGYSVIEWTSVLVMDLTSPVPLFSEHGGTVHSLDPSRAAEWATTSLSGWSEFPEYADTIHGIARVLAHNPETSCWYVSHEDTMVATASMFLHNGGALLSGASTVPSFRGKGAQQALLSARLRNAVQSDARFAMMCASPGSTSERNALRSGFRIAYTRTKFAKRIP
jgi:hypothetical protein